MFAVTWILHVTQWFWITGEIRIRPVEILYWTAMAAGVTAVLLTRAGGQEEEDRRKPGWDDWLRVPATLAAVSLLWGFWSMPTPGAWWEMVRRALW